MIVNLHLASPRMKSHMHSMDDAFLYVPLSACVCVSVCECVSVCLSQQVNVASSTTREDFTLKPVQKQWT